MELIENLLGAVNSKEEFDYLNAEKHFLKGQIDYFGEDSCLPLLSSHNIKSGATQNGSL